MDVAADCNGRVDNLYIGFFDEEFARFVTEFADGGFGDWFAGAEKRDGAGGSGLARREAGDAGSSVCTGEGVYRSRSLLIVQVDAASARDVCFTRGGRRRVF